MQEIIQFIYSHNILSTIWTILLVALLYNLFRELFSKIKIISRLEATYLLNKNNAILIDLRQNEDFNKGHIAGANNFLSNEIKSGKLSKLEKYKNKLIIIVDYTEKQAKKSADLLNKNGFKKVFILQEGISGWVKENLPLVHDKLRKR